MQNQHEGCCKNRDHKHDGCCKDREHQHEGCHSAHQHENASDFLATGNFGWSFLIS